MTFRTNSCYDHWWEGRKMFGSMGIHCLDVARVARGWLAKRDPQLAARILRLLIAYSAVFKSQLRDEVKVRSGHHGWLAATVQPERGFERGLEAWGGCWSLPDCLPGAAFKSTEKLRLNS